MRAFQELKRFQTLIGILQTEKKAYGDKSRNKFQTLIGILQTGSQRRTGFFLYSFQTLIGILQTALFLALFKLLSSF